MSAIIRWLAELHPLHEALQTLGGTPVVQSVAEAVSGQRDVAPVTLLQVILFHVLLFLLFLVLVPKARLAIWALWYWFVSSDKRTHKPEDRVLQSGNLQRKKIVFIRHGESEWNAVFNVGSKLMLPIRLFRALLWELLMLFEQDSLFIDAPLSSVGIQEAWDLLTFFASQPAGCTRPGSERLPVAELEVADLVSIIRGDVGESIIVSSILRRAISTGLLCLSPRLLKPPQHEKVTLMTWLQEISRNVDTLALTPTRSTPQVPHLEASQKFVGDLMSHFYRNRLDKKYNNGNKTIAQKAIKRQEQFVSWVFKQDYECVIVCGHSIWFREFFKSYLPKNCNHVGKQHKLVTCGCVAFDLYTDSHTTQILPESIKEVRGGFETKGKQKRL